jgi:hypothetical protein
VMRVSHFLGALGKLGIGRIQSLRFPSWTIFWLGNTLALHCRQLLRHASCSRRKLSHYDLYQPQVPNCSVLSTRPFSVMSRQIFTTSKRGATQILKTLILPSGFTKYGGVSQQRNRGFFFCPEADGSTAPPTEFHLWMLTLAAVGEKRPRLGFTRLGYSAWEVRLGTREAPDSWSYEPSSKNPTEVPWLNSWPIQVR